MLACRSTVLASTASARALGPSLCLNQHCLVEMGLHSISIEFSHWLAGLPLTEYHYEDPYTE